MTNLTPEHVTEETGTRAARIRTNPLHWQFDEEKQRWFAQTPMGRFWINELPTGKYEPYGCDRALEEQGGLDAAKQICEADYARRATELFQLVTVDLTPEHVAEVCAYLIDEAETTASDHRAMASRYSGNARKTTLAAAEQWTARAAWVREAEAHMTTQLQKPKSSPTA